MGKKENIRSILRFLTPADLVVVVFYLFLTVIHIYNHDKIDNWANYTFYNILAVFFIYIAAFFDLQLKHPVWKEIHRWYLILFVLLTFKQLYFIIAPVREIIIDDFLIKLDLAILGVNPTVELHKIATSLLTEILQIIYATFFFLPVLVAIDLIRSGKQEEFNFLSFIVVYGFVLSFIGYFLFPAIGPRFTIHNFFATDTELPGVAVTNYIRYVINSAEGIIPGHPDPASIVQRDAFPSGHTQLTLVTMFYAIKFRSKTVIWLIPVGILLIFSTVYLRYHYFVDLIGGLVFMLLTISTGKYIYYGWQNFRKGVK